MATDRPLTVLVTGGSGFIGAHVAAELRARGHGVRVMSRRAGAVSGAEHVQWDLRRGEGLERVLEGVDAVVHCAGALSGDEATQRADTVEATANLVRAMAVAGVWGLVGLSTLAIYDYLRIPEGSPLTEDSPLEAEPRRRAPYIAAKLEQERLIREHQGRWTILRPGLVLGPGRTWFHALGMHLAPTRWVCLVPSGLLPLTYVENCAQAVALALESEAASGATLNVIDDSPPTRGAYVNALAATIRPRPSVMKVSWTALTKAATLADAANRATGRRLPLPDLLNPPSLHSRCKPLLYPNERARRTLSWTPRFSFDEAFERSTRH